MVFVLQLGGNQKFTSVEAQLSSGGEQKSRACAALIYDSKVLVQLTDWDGQKGVWYHAQHYAAYIREKKAGSNCNQESTTHDSGFSFLV